MNEKYKKFKKEFAKKIYVSATSEYKRNTKIKVRGIINVAADIVFKEIMKNFLKGTNFDPTEKLLEGDVVTSKNGVGYVRKYIENEFFSYTVKTKNERGVVFNTTTYEIESTSRGYCNLIFSFSAKLPSTVVGFNGLLGNLKFKRDVKKNGQKQIAFLKNKLERKGVQ